MNVIMDVIKSGKSKWHIPLEKIPKSYKTSWEAGKYDDVVEVYCNRVVSGEAKPILHPNVKVEEICGNCINNIFKQLPHSNKVFILLKYFYE